MDRQARQVKGNNRIPLREAECVRSVRSRGDDPLFFELESDDKHDEIPIAVVVSSLFN